MDTTEHEDIWETELSALRYIYVNELTVDSPRQITLKRLQSIDEKERIQTYIAETVENEINRVEREIAEAKSGDNPRLNWAYYNPRNEIEHKTRSLKSLQKRKAILLEIAEMYCSITYVIPENYPHVFPIFYLDVSNMQRKTTITRQNMENINVKLRTIMTTYLGSEMIYAVSEECRNIVKKCAEYQFSQAEYDEQTNNYVPFSFLVVEDYDNGIDVTNPGEYVGDILHVCQNIDQYEVCHIENILREDLALRFEDYRKYLNRRYNPRRAELKRFTEMCVGFHGTSLQNIPSIVREGLRLPRENSQTHGSRYGRGIYLSPNAEFSYRYGQGKLIVCAYLPGKLRRVFENMWDSNCISGYESHISNCGNEVVLFSAAQVLPCYVIHYRTRSDREVADLRAMRNAAQLETRKQIRKALTQDAMKNLPFGFGRGKQFVVEEIAEVSDDEEDWGDYQDVRNDRYQAFRDA